jgi:predicted dehydrogenase
LTVYSAAVIGCGAIGHGLSERARVPGVHSHCEAYARSESTRLDAVCDLVPERATACADHWGVPHAYTDCEALLRDRRPALVSICTPDATHTDVLRRVVSAPDVRAVLVEKPLARDAREAAELLALAEARRVVLAVNYSRRFAPAYSALGAWLRAGGIGRFQTISGYYGKGLLHNGTHWLDLARAMVGEVETVWGRNRLDEAGPDPTLDVELAFQNGAHGYLFGLREEAFTLFEMDIVGTAGRVSIRESGHRVEVYEVTDSVRYRGYRELGRVESPFDGALEDVLLHAVEDLVDGLERGHPPRCSGHDGLVALAIAGAARASAADGRAHSPLEHL